MRKGRKRVFFCVCVLGRAAPPGSPFTAVDRASPPPLAIAAPAAPGAGQKPKLPAAHPSPFTPSSELPRPPHRTRHAEEEHLEALFQPFTIVIIITTSNQEMLLRRQSYSPRRRVTQGRSKPATNPGRGRRGAAPRSLSQASPPCKTPPPPQPAAPSLSAPLGTGNAGAALRHSRAAPRRRCLC